jgi:NADPH-dependent glutamate synthase beta subunit-like oxidoreductase
MPASEEEIEEALREGVDIQFLVAPSKVWRQNGHLKLECARIKLERADASGRRRPEPIAGSEFDKEFDTIVAAIGQAPQIPSAMGLSTERGGTLHVDPDTLAANVEGVFAGGDAVSGPASVIEAIAAGRKAAISIDKYLGGKGIIDEVLASPEQVPAPLEMAEEEQEQHRPKMLALAVSNRLKSFDLVECGFSEASAIEEACRCLRCDLEGE